MWSRRKSLFVSAFLLIGATTSVFWNLPHEQQRSRSEHMVMSVLWFQTSAEMRALSYQAFNVARMKIERDLSLNRSKKKKAVVVDIDETVLDNSPHMAKLIKENQAFPYAWADWVSKAQGEPLPGAVEFLNFVVSKDYDVFYVSNRSAETDLERTIVNLTAKGFPQATNDHVLLMKGVSSKEPRRKNIENTHELVLLMGDNLNDLANVFERKAVPERFAEVDKVHEEFGNRFIVLPNPMYGEWENAVYSFQRGLSDEQKDQARKAGLKAF